MTKEKDLESFEADLKRNLLMETTTSIVFPSPWANIKADNIHSCALQRFVEDLQTKVNNMLKPYAYTVLSSILEAEWENCKDKESVREQFDKLKEILNPPLGEAEAEIREEGVIIQDKLFEKFKNLDPEPFPAFMDNDVSFDNNGTLIILRPGI